MSNRATFGLVLFHMDADYQHVVDNCNEASSTSAPKRSSIDTKMEDEDLAICLLRGLPNDYDNVMLILKMSNAELKMQDAAKVFTNENIKQEGEKTPAGKLKTR
ncbi:hypothetical protein L917_21002 [Phytophthora nicotianae]|uniref:Uncharacterized protein n=1 Tax=Phytophthora nicotianae TaxID=4792 RepID=W2K0S7_PHYNI|nr:hypothetical protein L917_21002 [Phytophthora nicotianae]